MPKKVTSEKPIPIGYRVPKAIIHDIDLLIEEGYYKDRADFAYQATLDYLERTKARLSGRVIDFKIPLSKSDGSPEQTVKRPWK